MNTLSIRQERFCELVAEGRTYSEAYRIAYATGPEVSRQLGSRLMTKVNIQRRVRELRRPLLEDSLLTLEQKRQQLAAIVRVDVMALITDDGDLDLEAAKALPPCVLDDVSIRERRNRNGSVTRVIRVKVADKLKAIEVDNELAGHGEGGNAGLSGPVDDAVTRARAAARQKARLLFNDMRNRGLLPEIRQS